jgi:hypothetical protein
LDIDGTALHKNGFISGVVMEQVRRLDAAGQSGDARNRPLLGRRQVVQWTWCLLRGHRCFALS